MFDIQQLLITIPAVLICITIHEVAHGYVAYLLGDNTANSYGRLTLNPISHIDPIGLLCLVLFNFGWAKPVPVNARNFKNPKRDMVLVGAAGPVSNLLLALICFVLIRVIAGFTTISFISAFLTAFITFLEITAVISVGLAIFNLLPIPPLDGSKIIFPLLPRTLVMKILNYQQFISFGLIVLLWLGILSVPLKSARAFVTNILINIAFIGV